MRKINKTKKENSVITEKFHWRWEKGVIINNIIIIIIMIIIIIINEFFSWFLSNLLTGNSLNAVITRPFIKNIRLSNLFTPRIDCTVLNPKGII